MKLYLKSSQVPELATFEKPQRQRLLRMAAQLLAHEAPCIAYAPLALTMIGGFLGAVAAARGRLETADFLLSFAVAVAGACFGGLIGQHILLQKSRPHIRRLLDSGPP